MSKRPNLQAINTLNGALMTKGGGVKIPQDTKNFFIRKIGDQKFTQKLIAKLLETDQTFKEEYFSMMKRYPNKHVCDLSIRQLVTAYKKKKSK